MAAEGLAGAKHGGDKGEETGEVDQAGSVSSGAGTRRTTRHSSGTLDPGPSQTAPVTGVQNANPSALFQMYLQSKSQTDHSREGQSAHIKQFQALPSRNPAATTNAAPSQGCGNIVSSARGTLGEASAVNPGSDAAKASDIQATAGTSGKAAAGSAGQAAAGSAAVDSSAQQRRCRPPCGGTCQMMGTALVGGRIQIWWSGEREYFPGVVTAFSSKSVSQFVHTCQTSFGQSLDMFLVCNKQQECTA